MSLPSIAAPMKAANDVHFLSRVVPGWGVALSEIDYLRGWKDDFLGDQLRDQYTSEFVGIGSAITFPSTAGGNPGGWVNLAAGPGAARYARLWLGDAADGFASLDADLGWVQIAQLACNSVVVGGQHFQHLVGVRNAAATRYVEVGIDTLQSATNWIIQTSDGVVSTLDTGVPFGPGWQVHALVVYPDPVTAGYQADYYLQGRLIGSKTTNIPNNLLTPLLVSHSFGTTARNMDCNFWIVIPR